MAAIIMRHHRGVILGRLVLLNLLLGSDGGVVGENTEGDGKGVTSGSTRNQVQRKFPKVYKDDPS